MRKIIFFLKNVNIYVNTLEQRQNGFNSVYRHFKGMLEEARKNKRTRKLFVTKKIFGYASFKVVHFEDGQ